MALTDTKTALTSTTIQGAIIAIVSSAGAAYVAFKAGNWELLAASLSGVVGGIVSIIGRVKATKTIGKV